MCMPPASQCCNVKSCSVEICLAAMLQICCQSPSSSVHMQPTGAPPSNKTHVRSASFTQPACKALLQTWHIRVGPDNAMGRCPVRHEPRPHEGTQIYTCTRLLLLLLHCPKHRPG